MVVLGKGAVSYERGTPVPQSAQARPGIWKLLPPPPPRRCLQNGSSQIKMVQAKSKWFKPNQDTMVYRSTPPMRPPPPLRTLDIGLLQDPRVVRCLVSEVPLQAKSKHNGLSQIKIDRDVSFISSNAHIAREGGSILSPCLFFVNLVTGPRRSLGLKLSDTRVYEPQARTRLGTTK